ncbi:MAG: hypothetical protein ACI35R_02110 [Bacillus sp. (in: firmicutes)]
MKNFYEQLLTVQKLIEIIPEYSTVQRLKRTLFHYLLVSGKVGGEYVV